MLCSSFFIQMSSLVVDIMAQYFASVMDLTKIFYFLFFQVMRLSPTKVKTLWLISYLSSDPIFIEKPTTFSIIFDRP
jgi:hypothetical protein